METERSTDAALSWFNGLAADDICAMLVACCASRAWISHIESGRPYRTRAELLDTAELVCLQLADADLEEALEAHPRISDRSAGETREARWSREEQASVSESEAAMRSQLQAANVAYEQRFGRVFLIRAAGRSPAEILAESHRRLANDPTTEQAEVRSQLGQIARLRVEKLLGA